MIIKIPEIEEKEKGWNSGGLKIKCI